MLSFDPTSSFPAAKVFMLRHMETPPAGVVITLHYKRRGADLIARKREKDRKNTKGELKYGKKGVKFSFWRVNVDGALLFWIIY